MNGHSGDTTRPKVLQLGLIEHAHEAWNEIGKLATIIKPTATDRVSFLAEARSGAFDGCTVAYRTFESFDVTGKVDEEMLSALPSSLRFICHNGAGYDQVVVPACTKRGIRVSNTPTAVDDATADIGIFLMLGALRNLAASMASLRAGDWRGRDGSLPGLGHDPQGKTLGILGMGGIGRNMARKVAVFGMKVRYFNRTRLEPEVERECGAEYVDFETLLRESDVLSLNLPLNEHTRHIISKPQFDQMKDGVVIVNTARGAVMDEAALVDALASGKVYSCGLDVFENEPKIHPDLLANPNVFLVPHMGTWTVETQTKMEAWTISNVRLALTEGKLRSIVPEQAKVS
jgi:lactate dehydrogenase-like 2-hydroxyacid dehydrogenase